MPRKNKPDEVTASFHYLERTQPQNDQHRENIGFSQEEFDKLCQSIIEQPTPDLGDDNQFRQVKYGLVVPFSKIMRIDQRSLFGVFEGAYSGHAFKNSAKGEISAESINQRRFHFLLYLSDTGRIYVATQYLGHYGDYYGLKNTLLKFLPNRGNINGNSFRLDAIDFSKAIAKEVKVSISSKGNKITAQNLFSEGSMVAVKKRPKDDSFPLEVRNSLFSLIKSPLDKRKEAIAKLLRNSSIDVNDDDIDGCSVLATVNGRDRTIYILDGYNYASKFQLEVPRDDDGLPDYDKTKDAIYKILKEEIISRKEDV